MAGAMIGGLMTRGGGGRMGRMLPGGSPPSSRWDPRTGTQYLTPLSFSQNPQGQVVQNQQYYTSREDDPYGAGGGSLGALRSLSGGSSGGGSSNAGKIPIHKIESVWNKLPYDVVAPPTLSLPEHPGMSDEMTDSERATIAASKERSGQRLQSSLTGLRDIMAGRGISGSGLHSEGMGRLVAAALGEEADTERGLIHSREDRRRDIEDMNWRSSIDERMGNFGAGERYSQAQTQANRDAIDAYIRLLQYYGMAY